VHVLVVQNDWTNVLFVGKKFLTRRKYFRLKNYYTNDSYQKYYAAVISDGNKMRVEY